MRLALKQTILKGISMLVGVPFIPGFKEGGIVGRFQHGGIVPGVGFGDKVPALLEPGELVIPRKEVKEIIREENPIMNFVFNVQGGINKEQIEQFIKIMRIEFPGIYKDVKRKRRI